MKLNVVMNYRNGELESVSLSKEAFLTLVTSGKVTIHAVENAVGNEIPAQVPAKTPVNLDEEISKVLTIIGIPRHIKGFKYLRDAIIMCTNDFSSINQMTKLVYPTIAKNNNDTPSRVERSIRHAIELAYNPDSISKINSMFLTSYDPFEKKPCNSEIIALISDNLRMKIAG